MQTSWYRTGTVMLTAGSAGVVGADTAWLSQVQPGDLITFDAGRSFHEVAAVDSNTALTLREPYTGSSAAEAPYAVVRNFTSTLPAQIAAKIANMVDKWQVREEQYDDWVGGSPTGGPNGDGKYPLTDSQGVTRLVESPARLLQLLDDGVASNAEAIIAAIEDDVVVAQQARDQAETARDTTLAARDATTAARDATLAARDAATAEAATALTHATAAGEAAADAATAQGAAETARDTTLAARDAILVARDATVAASTDAQAAAQQAAAARDATLTVQDVTTAARDATVAARDDALAASVTTQQAADAATAAAATTAEDRTAVAADKATVAADKTTVAADKAAVAADRTAVTDARTVVEAAEANVQSALTQAMAAANTAAAAQATTEMARDVTVTKAAEAQASATTATQQASTAGTSALQAVTAATDATNAKFDVTAMKADVSGMATQASAAALLAQQFAETAEGEQVPGYAGRYSARHYSARAEYYMTQAAAIAGGSGFGIIGDGTVPRLVADQPAQMFNIINNTPDALTIGYLPGSMAVTFGSKVRPLEAGSDRLTIDSPAGGTTTILDVDPTAIDHDALTGHGAYTHPEIDAHLDATGNVHAVTAAQIPVEPTGSLTAPTVQEALVEIDGALAQLDQDKIDEDQRGVANGVATLGEDGKVPAAQIPDLDAAHITSGVFDIARLPVSVIERMVVVADQAARLALTTATAQNGDVVKEVDTGFLYYVVDDTQLGSEAGYEPFSVGSAASVPWSGVTEKPTTLLDYGITDAAPLDSPALTGTPTAPTPPQFDNDTSVPTTAFVQRALGNYSGHSILTGATTLAATWAGKITVLSGSAAYTVTLPAGIDMPSGATLTLRSSNEAGVTIALSGSDTWDWPTALTLFKGEEVRIVSRGTGAWIVSAISTDTAPVGQIAFFAMETSPPGWLVANGQAHLVTAYPQLAAAMYPGDAKNATAAFGYRCVDPGNPNTTRSATGSYFVLPDLRGEFVRGWDNGRGVDPGRVFGTSQKGTAITGDTANDGGATVNGIANIAGINADPPDGVARNIYWVHSTGTVSEASIYWATVRPRNVALLPCIKAFSAIADPALVEVGALANSVSALNVAIAQSRTNKLHNGRFLINQRGGGPWTTSGVTSDRWYAAPGTAMTARVADDPQSNARNMLELVTTTVVAAPVADAFCGIYQSLEGWTIGDLEWGTANAKPVTVMFTFDTNVPGTYSVVLRKIGFGQSCVKTFNAVAGRNEVRLVFPGPTIGTWGVSGNLAEVTVLFTVVAGSAYIADTTDAWVAGNKLAGPGQVNLGATLNAYARWAGMVMAADDTPLPAASYAVDYDIDFARCQRYYQILPAHARFAATGPNAWMDVSIPFIVPMRATPTLLIGGSGGKQLVAAEAVLPNGGSLGALGCRYSITSSGAGDVYGLDRTIIASAEI
ncbi:MAG TPA: phage tail protein [Azospirillum sp.]|nr:phage tail protein [Azospirillum sp.]